MNKILAQVAGTVEVAEGKGRDKIHEAGFQRPGLFFMTDQPLSAVYEIQPVIGAEHISVIPFVVESDVVDVEQYERFL